MTDTASPHLFLCLLGCLNIMFWVIIHSHCEVIVSIIRAESIALYTSGLILLLPSALTSSTNTSNQVQLVESIYKELFLESEPFK